MSIVDHGTRMGSPRQTHADTSLIGRPTKRCNVFHHVTSLNDIVLPSLSHYETLSVAHYWYVLFVSDSALNCVPVCRCCYRSCVCVKDGPRLITLGARMDRSWPFIPQVPVLYSDSCGNCS